MDVDTRNLVALHGGSRIPYEIGSFLLDDHDVQEWSDNTNAGMKHRARKEVGKWIDPDRKADIQFQRREDSKQSDNTREQQRTEVIQGSAPDSAFQIVRSQRNIQDIDDKSGARITTMSTSYQMSSSRGVRSTTKTTSSKTTSTKTVSGGQSVDFENLKMSFQPMLVNNVARERINVSRNSGTHRRPPTRRHVPAAALSNDEPLGRTEIRIEEIIDDEEDADNNNTTTIHHNGLNESVRISEIHSSTNSSSSTHNNNSSKVTEVPISIVGFKNISPKIRVGFPVEIQLELQSKLRNGDQNHHIITELNGDDDDDDIINHEMESPSKLLSSSTSTLSASNTTLTSSSSTQNLTSQSEQQQATSSIMDTNNFRNSKNTNLQTTKQQNLQKSTSTTKITEAENSKESIIDKNESATFKFPSSMRNSIHHTNNNNNNRTVAAPADDDDDENTNNNNGRDLTFDFNNRRKSYGFESFDPYTSSSSSLNNNNTNNNNTKNTKEYSNTRISDETPLSRHITTNSPTNIYSNNRLSSSKLNGNSTTTTTNGTSTTRIPSFNNLAAPKLTPSSLSRSWDLIQNAQQTAQQRRGVTKKKLFSSSSDLDDLTTTTTSNSSRRGGTSNSNSKNTAQKTIITLNPYEDEEGNEPEYNGVKRRLSHEFTLDSLESFPGMPSSNSKNRQRSVSSDNIQKAHIEYPPDVIYHNIQKESDSTLLPEKSRKLGHKMLDETPDLLNKMSFMKQNYFPTSHPNDTSEIEEIKSWTKNIEELNNINNHSNSSNMSMNDKTYNSNNNNNNSKQRDENYMNESLNQILHEGKELKTININTKHSHHSNNKNINNENPVNPLNSKYNGTGGSGSSFENIAKTSLIRDEINTKRTTKTNRFETNNNNTNNKDEEDDDDILKNGGGFDHYKYDEPHYNNNGDGKKQTKISQTWISPIDQKPSQTARDPINDVTTSISATNDQLKKTQKRVEFCKTEVHFTPESGRFHIVETDDNKPSTIHLYRRKRKNDKNKANQSSSSSSETNNAPSKKSIELLEKLNQINQEQEIKTTSSTATTTSQQHQRSTNITNTSKNVSAADEDSEGLELVKKKKSAKVVVDDSDVGGGVGSVGVSEKKSLFHHHHQRLRLFDEENNNNNKKKNDGGDADDNDNILLYSGTQAQVKDGESLFPLLPTLKSRSKIHDNSRDSNKLVRDDFDDVVAENSDDADAAVDEDELIHSQERRRRKESSSSNIINGDHLYHNNNNHYMKKMTPTTTKLINDFADTEEGDESRSSDVILSNYGELKTLRYLNQLKKNKQQQQRLSEWDDQDHVNQNHDERMNSPINFLQHKHNLGRSDPDQVEEEIGVDDDDDQDDFEDSSKFDNVLYENGSFVPLATRRSLIELNNRNRKSGSHNVASRHSHTSDNSSTTTSNYSLPHSDNSNNNNNRYKLIEDSSTDLEGGDMNGIINNYSKRLNLDKDMLNSSSYFSEPVKRNYKIPKSNKNKRDEIDDDDDIKEKLYDFSTPVQPELRSLPPYSRNRNLTPPNPNDMIVTSKPPPVPILPSQFSRSAALRERFNAKNSQSSYVSNLNNNNNNSSNNDHNNINESFESYNSKNRRLSHNITDTTSTTTIKPESLYTPSKSIVNIGNDDGMDTNETGITDETELGFDGIDISPEPMLSQDHTYKGPAYFDNQSNMNSISTGAKSAPVMRSMTFPKATRPEPEWVSKAKSRENRMMDWSLIGCKQQNGSSTTTRKSEPPWLTEIRFKSKPTVATVEQIQSLPKISVVYPWERNNHHNNNNNTTSTSTTIIGTQRDLGTTITEQINNDDDPYSSKNYSKNNHNNSIRQTESAMIVKENQNNNSNAYPFPSSQHHNNIEIIDHQNDEATILAAMKKKKRIKKIQEGELSNMINATTTDTVTKNNNNNTTTSMNTNRNITDMNRDSDSIIIKTDQIPAAILLETSSLSRKERKYPKQYPTAIVENISNTDDSIDKKLLAPLTESTKPASRKPLQSSSTANKNIIINNNNHHHHQNNQNQNINNNNNINAKLPPRSVRPPRPPKPPQRISSLPKSSLPKHPPLPSRRQVPQNSSNNNSDAEESSNMNGHGISPSSRSNPIIHKHPLKVAKIPTTCKTSDQFSGPDGKSSHSKNKAKHNVTYETKLKVQSKLLNSDNTSQRLLSKVAPTSTRTTTSISLSPSRKR